MRKFKNARGKVRVRQFFVPESKETIDRKATAQYRGRPENANFDALDDPMFKRVPIKPREHHQTTPLQKAFLTPENHRFLEQAVRRYAYAAGWRSKQDQEYCLKGQALWEEMHRWSWQIPAQLNSLRMPNDEATVSQLVDVDLPLINKMFVESHQPGIHGPYDPVKPSIEPNDSMRYPPGLSRDNPDVLPPPAGTPIEQPREASYRPSEPGGVHPLDPASLALIRDGADMTQDEIGADSRLTEVMDRHAMAGVRQAREFPEDWSPQDVEEFDLPPKDEIMVPLKGEGAFGKGKFSGYDRRIRPNNHNIGIRSDSGDDYSVVNSYIPARRNI